MKAKIRDTEIYFDVDGPALVADGRRMRERPIAMVIHGGPGMDHTGMKASFSVFAEDMQLVFFDHRGQGRSARGDTAKYNLDENVEDMECLRQHLGLGKIVSIGHSYGGMVAMAHAARYPDAVAKLILSATASHGGFITRAQQIVNERATPKQQQACRQLWDGSFKTPDEMFDYFEILGPFYSLKYDAAKAADSRGRAILTVDPLNLAFNPNGFLRSFDLRPELKNIKAPTLIMAGRQDWICAPEFSEEIHSLIPGSKLMIFEQSSHSLRSDAPEKSAEAIKNFVKTPLLEPGLARVHKLQGQARE